MRAVSEGSAPAGWHRRAGLVGSAMIVVRARTCTVLAERKAARAEAFALAEDVDHVDRAAVIGEEDTPRSMSVPVLPRTLPG